MKIIVHTLVLCYEYYTYENICKVFGLVLCTEVVNRGVFHVLKISMTEAGLAMNQSKESNVIPQGAWQTAGLEIGNWRESGLDV